MKTHEEWRIGFNLPKPELVGDNNWNEIFKAVQTDALREAAEIAANSLGSSNYNSHYQCAAMIIRDAILAKAKELEP